MLLLTKDAEDSTLWKRKFQKLSKFILYLPLVGLIVISTMYFGYEHHYRLQREINIETVKSKSVQDNLLSNVRIFCLITISQPNDPVDALKVHKTWASRCDRALFVSSQMHEVLEPLIILEPIAVDEHKWMRLRLALRYVYENHLDEAGWFLIVGDHNFVVVENLRKMLQPHSPGEALTSGCLMKNKENKTYMHGGYVLSHEAMRRLVELSFTNSSICNLEDSPYDDEELGRCLRNVDVRAVDSRDAMGRQRFVPFPPEEYLLELEPEKQAWYGDRSYYEINTTTRAMSPEVILFSNVNAATMVTLYYYIYKLKIFGRKVQSRNVTELFARPIPRVNRGD